MTNFNPWSRRINQAHSVTAFMGELASTSIPDAMQLCGVLIRNGEFSAMAPANGNNWSHSAEHMRQLWVSLIDTPNPNPQPTDQWKYPATDTIGTFTRLLRHPLLARWFQTARVEALLRRSGKTSVSTQRGLGSSWEGPPGALPGAPLDLAPAEFWVIPSILAQVEW